MVCGGACGVSEVGLGVLGEGVVLEGVGMEMGTYGDIISRMFHFQLRLYLLYECIVVSKNKITHLIRL